jgi:hypothetical protein
LEAFDYVVGEVAVTERGGLEEHGNLLKGVFCANVQTEPKQGLKMQGRLQAGTKIVSGKVARAREE